MIKVMHNQQRRIDKKREYRIDYEVVVDCYYPEEQSLGWYYYLHEKCTFPFTARCNLKKATSPLKKGETVRVLGMPSECECEYDMLANVAWDDDEIAVPFFQLSPVKSDPKTKEAIEDWHYWVERGYRW
jgi:hypothetical protein